MIRHLPYEQIDKEKWDNCVSHSPNTRIYGHSWFLDIVAGQWEGLIEDDYSSVLPLTFRTKKGITYLYQPFFTQQLGLFSLRPVTLAMAEEFILSIPEKIRFSEIQLNSENPVPEKYIHKMRRNHELDISRSYPDLIAGYNQNTRRNLKKSQDYILEIRNDLTPALMVSFFRENYGNKEGKLTGDDYIVLEKLLTTAMERRAGETRAVFFEGRLCAAIFFLKDEKRIIYHLAATSPEGKEKAAMFLLTDRLLKEFSGNPLILDFEGSDNENVSRFYKGFGGTEILYPMVRINRLPFLMEKLVILGKKIRRR